MIGVLLFTHGPLGEALVKTLENIVGPQENIKCIACNPHDDLEVKRKELNSGIDEVNTGHGVVILTDMFGGTPSNLAMSVLGLKQIEVIAGVNLPMFIELVEHRHSHTLPDVAQKAFDAGRKYIQIASTLLSPAQIVNA